MAPAPLSAADPRLAKGALMVECVPPWDGTVREEGGQVFELDGQLARLPVPAAAPFARREVAAVVCEALNAAPRLLPSEVRPAEVEHAAAALAPLSAGGLKSLLQKALRFHARGVDLGFGAAGGGATLPTPLVAAVGAALLFAERGSFSPELQTFTRGGTAAFKRAAVVLLEDAWPGSMVEHVVTTAAALATHGPRRPRACARRP